MYRPLAPGPAASESVWSGGGGVYGSPFFDDGRGGSPAEAYRQWLTGSRTAGELGTEPMLWVCISRGGLAFTHWKAG